MEFLLYENRKFDSNQNVVLKTLKTKLKIKIILKKVENIIKEKSSWTKTVFKKKKINKMKIKKSKIETY